MPQVIPTRPDYFKYLAYFCSSVLVACSAVLLFWGFLDHQVPVTGVNGYFLGWDKNEPNRAHVKWTAVLHRSCDGMMYRWAFSGTDMVELESTAVQDFSFPEDEIGKPVKWYSTFLVPTWFKDNAQNPTYRLRMEFYCNPLQRHSPLIVAPPEIPLTVTERAKDAVEPPRVQSQRNTP